MVIHDTLKHPNMNVRNDIYNASHEDENEGNEEDDKDDELEGVEQ